VSRGPAPPSRARDLAYSIYRRPVHPELLPVEKAASVGKPRWKARVLLLERTGHAVSFASSAGEVLLEIVALSGVELPSGGRVDVRPLSRVARDRVKVKGDLLYACSYAVETSAPDEFARRHAKILGAKPKGQRLLVERAHPENDGPSPFSLVDWEAKESSLETFAVHAFPRERAFVFVQSSFAPEPARKK
jgi:hypothetical protein